MPRPSVQHTVDFNRVRDLPRRVLNESDADAWAEVFTDQLRAKGSKAVLRRWQGQCFAEAVENLGGFYVLPVGFGKTILSYELGHVLHGKRVLLILPANMIKSGKTANDFRSYVGQWQTPNPPPWPVSTAWLALDANADFLETFQPDVIIIDESDELANFGSATAQRLDRTSWRARVKSAPSLHERHAVSQFNHGLLAPTCGGACVTMRQSPRPKGRP
jgi:hypothetical protein